MRELKFRAWDKLSKQFLAVGFTILGEVNCFDLIGSQLKRITPDKPILERLKDVEITQFTGLKDKNGKEIYEGDILCIEDENLDILELADGNHTTEVIFKAGIFGVEILDDGKYFNRDFFSLREIIFADYEISENTFEIIGNKFENPELLNKE